MSQVEYEDVDQGSEAEEEETQYVAVEDDPEGQTTDEHEGEEDDDEEGEETRLGGGREDDDEQKEQRRQENKTRRARQREARDRDKRELGFLRKRNEDLERRFSQFEQETDARITGSEVASIDTQINKSKSDLALANQVIEQAIEANDGKNVAEALNHRDAIRDNLRDLEQAKEYLSQERQPPQQELDPRHVAHAQSFMTDHEWWDPAGRDRDSQTVLAIDRSLVQEGYDPRNKDYWDELRGRVSQELPEHFEGAEGNQESDDADDGGSGGGRQQTQRRGGPTFRTGGRERALKKNEVYISPERREAMEEAGVWDDPVLRNKYLASYAKYDREQAEQGA